MVTREHCERAVQNGNDWYCPTCERFNADEDSVLFSDHLYEFSEPLCEGCHGDVVPATTAHTAY